MLPTPYQDYIALSRYCRFREDLGRRELWPEAVDRLLDFWQARFPEPMQRFRPFLREQIITLNVMPSMRTLMTAGPALSRDEIAGYNCSATAVTGSGGSVEVATPELQALGYDKITLHARHPIAFDEAMYLLLCGVGVGFSVERQFIAQLPKLNTPLPRKIYAKNMFPGVPSRELSSFDRRSNTIVVADSKYGWASALRILIVELYNGNYDVQWDVSGIRPAGTPLRTFGGRASGPESLIDLFTFVTNVFRNAQGPRLTSLECHDIMCRIASVVVAGGTRRSALLSLSNLSDERMRSAKSGAWWETEGQRALANNSVAYTERPTVGAFMREWQALYDSRSGERGIFNREAAKKACSAIGRDPEHDFLVNPCFTGDTLIQTVEGHYPIAELVGRTVDVWDGKEFVSVDNFRVTGESQEVFQVTLRDGSVIKATAYHTFVLEDGTKVELKDLKVGAKLMVSTAPVSHTGTYHSEAFMEGFGTLVTTAQVPTEAFSWSFASRAAFLAGVFAANAISFTENDHSHFDVVFGYRVPSSNTQFLRDIQSLLKTIGVYSTLRDRFLEVTMAEAVALARVSAFRTLSGFMTLLDRAGSMQLRPDLRTFNEVVSITSAGVAAKVYCCTVDTTHMLGLTVGVVTGQCSEVILRPKGLCNLSEAVIRPDDTLDSLRTKVKAAAILGTLQSTLTNFVYLSPEWRQNAEEERLLGVSLTGWADHPVLSRVSEQAVSWLTELKLHVKKINKNVARELGIPVSAATTCTKPSGTVSQLVNCASGVHPRFAPYYIRRVRSDRKDPVARMLIEQGFPHEVDVTTPHNYVFSFPMKSPDHCLLRDDVRAIDQLEHWLMVKRYWCEHTVSVSIYVRENEWLDVAAWVYKHFDDLVGVSFFPYTDHVYRQAPYEAITAEQYEALVAQMPAGGLDIERLREIETTDMTTTTGELSCTSGACEL